MPGGISEMKQLFRIRDILRQRGSESRLKLAVLLQNNDRFVRYYTAQELIGLLPNNVGQ
jgi:hypothetical protein